MTTRLIKKVAIAATLTLTTALAQVPIFSAAQASEPPYQDLVFHGDMSHSGCSPVNGEWYFQGRPGPIISQFGDKLSIDMSVYRRPTATGRFLSSTQIEVTFPDDGTFIGTLDGKGNINWNNGTVWQALSFDGVWNYEGAPGPIVTQLDNNFSVDMSDYRRPKAMGTITAPGRALVNFPDDTTHTATLMSPSCIQWSNGTIWTR